MKGTYFKYVIMLLGFVPITLFAQEKITDSTQMATYLRSLINQQIALSPAIEAARKNAEKDPAAFINERNKLVEILTQRNSAIKGYLKEHPDADIDSTLFPRDFFSYQNSMESLMSTFNALSMQGKNSAAGKQIQAAIEEKERRARLIGSLATDFTLPDQNGKMVSLSSFKGKYVLIDLWASYCGPCREANPRLLDIYKKYHNKGLEIIQISDDVDTVAWHKAIIKDNVSILHQLYIDKKNHPENAHLLEKYGFNTLGGHMLIDKDRKLIGYYPSLTPDVEKTEEKQLETLFP